MSLFTNPNAILVSDGESSEDGSDWGCGAADYVYGRPRRYGDDYYDDRDNSRSSGSSSVDELVRHTLHRRYTQLERELGTAAGLYGSPFRVAVNESGDGRRVHSRGVAIATASEDEGDEEDQDPDAATARDVAYLQRLRRGLAEMRMKERPDALEGEAGRKPKPKVVITKEAINRLTKPNTSMAAKQQEKYEKRIEREKKEQEEQSRAPPSKLSIKAGERLHLQAKGHRQERERMQQEHEEVQAQKAEKECTFQPTITPLAEQLALGGYRTVEERLEEHKRKQEDIERRRIEMQVEEMRKLPFRPTLCQGSNAMVEMRRARSRTRSRSRSRSCHRRLLEDPAERLYREGGERLLRQQIRQRQAEQALEKVLIGNNVKLTHKKQEQVNNRLEAWQQTREKNIAALREEAERMRMEQRNLKGRGNRPAPPAQDVAVIAREPAAPPAAAAPTHPPSTASSGQAVEATSRPLSVASTVAASAQAAHASPPVSVSGVDPFARFTSHQKVMYQELRRLRFGALFYKYTAGGVTGDDVVTLDQVRRVVTRIYPEDAGVVHALSLSAGSNSQLSFSKDAFVQVLTDYEQRFGPQPWGRTEKDALLFPAPLPEAGPAATSPSGGGHHSSTRSSSVPAAQPRLTRSPSMPEAQRQYDSGATRVETTHPCTAAPSTASRQKTRAGPKPIRSGSERAAKVPIGGGEERRVAGYDAHVTRMRARSASAPRGRTSLSQDSPRTYARCLSANAVVQRPRLPDCTFSPRLNKRTKRLSSIDLERRESYAQEMALRKKELELLRVLQQSSDSPSGQKKTPAKTLGGGTAPQRGRSTESATAAADGGLSPSIELSSLSGSLGRSPIHSAATAAATAASQQVPLVAKPRTPLQGAAASKAILELQSLLDNAAPSPASGGHDNGGGLAQRPPRTTVYTHDDGAQNQQAAVDKAKVSPPSPVVPAARGMPPQPKKKASAPVSAEAAKGAAFTEENVDELFDAMYRRDVQSSWL